jgi:hypothetical protein
MRKIRIVAVLIALVAVAGLGAGPASAHPYRFASVQVVSGR